MLPQTNLMPQKVPLRFTVDEYYKLIDLGMLHDYEKAETIDGELISRIPLLKLGRFASKFILMNTAYLRNHLFDLFY
jgi:hypothetical protein